MKVLLVGRLEDLEPYSNSSDEIQRQMRWCWNNSFPVSLDDDANDTAPLYVSNNCRQHQLSLMAWLYDGAVRMYPINIITTAMGVLNL